MTSASLRFVVVALMLGATALLLQARSSNEVSPPREPLTSLPDHFGPWVGQDLPIDQQTRDILGLAFAATLNKPIPTRAQFGLFRM